MPSRPRPLSPASWIALAVLAAGVLAAECLAQEERPPEKPPAAQAAGAGAPSAGARESQDPVKKPAPTGDEEEKEDELPGTLRIWTDAACRLEIDGRPEGELTADKPRVVRVPLGPVKVRAIALETSRAEWETTVEVTAERASRVRIRMSRSIAEVRRKERQTESYRDSKTGLMWVRRDNGADVTWQGADSYCEELGHGGFDNWRLPAIDELDTLKAIWSMQAFKTIGGVVLTACCAWSSTTAESGQAWNYNFRYRRGFTGNVAFRLGMRALCVRSLEPAELEELTKKAIKAKRKARKERKKEKEREGGEETEGPEEPSDPPP